MAAWINNWLSVNLMNGHWLKGTATRRVINGDNEVGSLVKDEVCWRDSEAEVFRITFGFKPLSDEVDVQHQIAAASVFAFDNANSVDGVVVPIELRELVEYGHAMTPNVEVSGLRGFSRRSARLPGWATDGRKKRHRRRAKHEARPAPMFLRPQARHSNKLPWGSPSTFRRTGRSRHCT